MLLKEKNIKLSFSFLIILLFLSMVLSCTIGLANISFLKSLKVLLSSIPLIGGLINTEGIENTQKIIILNIRMPRILLSALLGAGLSSVGAAFQALFKNPMADPYILGISSGAALGATIAIIMGLSSLLFGAAVVGAWAFLGAFITSLVVYNIAKVGNRVPIVNLLLSGIALSFFLSSIISILMVFNRNDMEKVMYWIMGSVSAASYKEVVFLAVVLLFGIFVLLFFYRELNVMTLGEDTAITLGVEIEKVKKIIIAVSSLMVAACVSVSGIIGFVGLIIPHTVRLLFGSDSKKLLAFSVIVGGIFMVFCDTLARVLIPPAELPVGIITSVFGAPFFIYLLIKSKGKVV